MSNVNDGGPAFPVSTMDRGDGPQGDRYGHQDAPSTWQFPGLTIRDYFAAKAMQSLILDSHYQSEGSYKGWGEFSGEVASESYEMADAMLKARQS